MEIFSDIKVSNMTFQISCPHCHQNYSIDAQDLIHKYKSNSKKWETFLHSLKCKTCSNKLFDSCQVSDIVLKTNHIYTINYNKNQEYKPSREENNDELISGSIVLCIMLAVFSCILYKFNPIFSNYHPWQLSAVVSILSSFILGMPIFYLFLKYWITILKVIGLLVLLGSIGYIIYLLIMFLKANPNYLWYTLLPVVFIPISFYSRIMKNC